MLARTISCVFILFAFLLVADNCNAEIYTSIAGVVIGDDTNAGIPQVEVYAELTGSKEENYYTVTDNYGRYLLNDLKPGTYKIGYSKTNSPYVSVKPTLEITLPIGVNVVNANYKLKLGGAVSGKVIDASGIPPNYDVLVLIDVPDAPAEWLNLGAQFIDDEGQFYLNGIPETDNCIIKVQVKGHPLLTKAVGITKGAITENVNVVLEWDETTGVTGYAKSLSGRKPTGGMSIAIVLWDMLGNPIAQDLTDENGEYSITGVEPGVYKLTAMWPILVPEEGDYIDEANIIVEKSKLTTVNFEFKKY